jgi:hypothetical protein
MANLSMMRDGISRVERRALAALGGGWVVGTQRFHSNSVAS